MKNLKRTLLNGILPFLSVAWMHAQLPTEIDQSWELTWSDEFNYPNSQLEQNWTSQNGPSNHILSGRYRDNAVVNNGVLELRYKKENRGGQQWTSGNIWTNQEFQYGYFECRYKYAAAGATNNSFWIMNRSFESITPPGRGFELDINEGHFPNEVNTNIHKFDVGFTNRTTDSRSHVFGIEAGVNLPLEIPITTRKIRFSSNNTAHFHIREFRIYNDNNRNFPAVLSETADTDVPGLINHARSNNTQITVSGTFDNTSARQKENMVDGNVQSNSWVSQINGQKWIEFEWSQNKTVGAIQFINGWNGPDWKGIISDYKIEYWNGSQWVEIAKLDVATDNNFAEEYHTYGFKWDENEFVWYFDGQEIRRTPNTHAYGFAPIWLSGAVIGWSGPVTDAIDGTSMKIDYVRVYKKRNDSGGNAEAITAINGPNTISQNQTINVVVDYNTNTSRDIRVNFKGMDGTLFGHQIKTVNGNGSETFAIEAPNAPVGAGYVLQGYMSPVDGNWNNRIGDPIEQRGISVTAAAIDNLIAINGPTTIDQNETIQVTVDYSTTTSRDIRVNFKSANGTLYGHQIKTVTNNGSATFNISTSNLPAGTGYVLQAYMSPVGGNWSNRIGNPIEKRDIMVLETCDVPYAGPNYSVSKTTNNWSSGSIDISCLSKVNIEMRAEGTGPMEQADYLNISYKVDNGAPIAMLDQRDSFSSKIISATGITGNSLELIIHGFTSYQDEIYTVKNITVVDATLNLRSSLSKRLKKTADIALFPNPVSSTLHVNFSNINTTTFVDIAIYNTTGKEIMTKRMIKENTALELSDLPNGLYILKITDGNEQSFQKFVKK